MNIVLIGLRGAGKTTIGRLLAPRLGFTFVDLDDVTPTLLDAGLASVREAWERFGEARFRDAEVRALRRVLAGDRQIVALGGGTPTATTIAQDKSHKSINAADLLREHRLAGYIKIAYLRATPDVLKERLAPTDHAARPSLTGKGTLEEIPEIFARRDPLYTALADRTLEVGTADAGAIIASLESWLKQPA